MVLDLPQEVHSDYKYNINARKHCNFPSLVSVVRAEIVLILNFSLVLTKDNFLFLNEYVTRTKCPNNQLLSVSFTHDFGNDATKTKWFFHRKNAILPRLSF